jgi:hypothetical protein
MCRCPVLHSHQRNHTSGTAYGAVWLYTWLRYVSQLDSKEEKVFEEGHHDSLVQRGIDEALACQDMLERTPVKPSWVSQMVTRVVVTARSIADRKTGLEHRSTATAPHANR